VNSDVYQNARLLRFLHPSPFDVPHSTPHGSGFQKPCIRTFLNGLRLTTFNNLSEAATGVSLRTGAGRAMPEDGRDKTASAAAGLDIRRKWGHVRDLP